jgi:tetratricopeptide (TPR) repeat protein
MDTYEVMKGLTELVAAHGVYAITVILIFFMWRRAFRDMHAARSEAEKKSVRKVYISVVVGTYVAMAISTGVWFYANFVYKYQNVVRGVITELNEQQAVPKTVSDAPKIVQSISPERSDLPFFSCKRHELTDSKYEMSWVLLPDRGMNAIIFRFQQVSAIIKMPSQRPSGAAAGISQSPSPTGEAQEKPIGKTIGGTFKVFFSKSQGDLLNAIQLVYKPNTAQLDRLGAMFLRDPANGDLDTLKWLDTSESEGSVASSGIKPTQLMASLFDLPFVDPSPFQGKPAAKNNTFGVNGEYDVRTGNALKQSLGGMDLTTQYEAIDLLVGNGSRSFKFIQDCLSDSGNTNYDKNQLVHHLSEAVKSIEAKGSPFPQSGHLKFALALYNLGDYQASANHFVAAGEKALTKKSYYFLRGYAYDQAGYHDEAVNSYQKYIRSTTARNSIAVAQCNLGVVYEHKGQIDSAIQSYKKAIKADSEYTPSYNGLASLYALNNRHLSEALVLIDKALEMVPNSAPFTATKALVLGQLGRNQEAIEFNETALGLNPNYEMALNNLAYLYAEEGIELDSAMSMIDRALKMAPNDASLLDTKGWIHYKKGEYQQAQILIQAAVSKSPKSKEILEHVRMVQEALAKSGGTGK